MFLPEHYKHELGWGLEDLRGFFFFLERIQTTTHSTLSTPTTQISRTGMSCDKPRKDP